MTNDELRKAQARLGWENAEMAQFLGYSLSNVVKLRRDGNRIPTAVARAVCLYEAITRYVDKAPPDAPSVAPLRKSLKAP